MSQIWFVSDPHFNHENMLKFTNYDGTKVRDFENVQVMNETMVERWNSRVRPDDVVYCNGDVFFGPEQNAFPWLMRLNGRKELVLGNHDPDLDFLMRFFPKVHLWKKFRKHNFILSHMPLHPSVLDEMSPDCANVHGHIHGNESPKDAKHKYINICVEKTDYFPVSLNEILEKIGK